MEIETLQLEENEKLPLLGEGKIMRAFYYYLLTSFFGDVPFYTEHVADVETQQKIGRLGRMSAVETREYLIKELSAIVPSMDQVRYVRSGLQSYGCCHRMDADCQNGDVEQEVGYSD